jgi:hypothetical protein
MPKVKDVRKHLDEIASQVKRIDTVSSVYFWGSIVKYASKPNYPVRDIDIIAETTVMSQDLLSIVKDDYTNPFKMTNKQLEEEGFSIDAVNFTKRYASIDFYNLDRWAISSDKKLLHWGPVVTDREEWDDIHAQAEKNANNTIGTDRKHLISKIDKKSWYEIHNSQVSLYMKTAPMGWYEVSDNIEDILKESEKWQLL